MSFEEPLKVLVVDDHAGIRVGIAGLIDAQCGRMCCVGAAATGREALARTRELQPHVIVLDVNLDGEDGLALIPTLRRDACSAIVVLTSFTDPQIAVRAMRLGAHACLNKTSPAADLIDAIVAAGLAEGHGLGPTPSNAGGAFSHAPGTNRPSPLGALADAPRRADP